MPEWHLELLREREERYKKEGMKGIPLEEIEKELFGDLTDPSKDET